MKLDSKICIIGHKGTLGHAIVDELKKQGYTNIIGCDLPEVDLCNQEETRSFFEREKPQYIFYLAAISAGINYKISHPATMLIKNTQIITNVFESVAKIGCKKLISVCSALIYPKTAEIPLKEESATIADLNTVDAPYSLAKVLGMLLAKDFNIEYHTNFLTVVPCNFFGEYAAFSGEKAGVVPALIGRIAEAKISNKPEVEIWGTGNACREILYSKDVASACIHLMKIDVPYDLINIGRGEEYSIKDIATRIRKVIGYKGKIVFDVTKPEGRLHTQLDSSKLSSLGWEPKYSFEEGVKNSLKWYMKNRKI